VALWAALTLPSFLVAGRLGGWPGDAALAVAAGLGVVAWRRLPAPASRRGVALAALATLAVVTALFLAIYPRVNVHTPGSGSDDDDAQNIGVAAILHGRSPYGERTYLGNRLHHLPGTFLLASPFVLAGSSAIQNLFWVAMFFVAIAAGTGSPRRALQLAWLVLAASPGVLHQIVTGTAYAANTIAVLIGLNLIVRREGSDRLDAGDVAAAAFWGVTLATRANFLFLAPIAFGWIARQRGWRAAGASVAIAGGVAALLTLPFLVHDGAAFAPLEAANRLTRFDAVVPHAGAAIVIAMAAATCLMAFRLPDAASVYYACASVEAVPVVAGLALGLWRRGRFDAGFASYATFFAWFVFAGTALDACRTEVYPKQHAVSQDVILAGAKPAG